MTPRNNGHNDYVFEGEVIERAMPPVHIPYQRAVPIPKPPHTEHRRRSVLEMLGMKPKSLEADHEERLLKDYLVGRELVFRREAGTAMISKNLQTVGHGAHNDQQFVASLPFNSYAQNLAADILADMGARQRLAVAKDAELFETLTDEIHLKGR